VIIISAVDFLSNDRYSMLPCDSVTTEFDYTTIYLSINIIKYDYPNFQLSVRTTLEILDIINQT
jgi:hypothetical protein